jgi:hypothetical protein
MEISEAKEIIEKIIREYGPNNKSIRYEIVPKLGNADASYVEAEYKIYFRSEFIKRTEKDELIDVVLHELAHARVEDIKSTLKMIKLVRKMKQQGLGKYVDSVDFGHGKRWKSNYKILREIYEVDNGKLVIRGDEKKAAPFEE